MLIQFDAGHRVLYPSDRRFRVCIRPSFVAGAASPRAPELNTSLQHFLQLHSELAGLPTFLFCHRAGVSNEMRQALLLRHPTQFRGIVTAELRRPTRWDRPAATRSSINRDLNLARSEHHGPVKFSTATKFYDLVEQFIVVPFVFRLELFVLSGQGVPAVLERLHESCPLLIRQRQYCRFLRLSVGHSVIAFSLKRHFASRYRYFLASSLFRFLRCGFGFGPFHRPSFLQCCDDPFPSFRTDLALCLRCFRRGRLSRFRLALDFGPSCPLRFLHSLANRCASFLP